MLEAKTTGALGVIVADRAWLVLALVVAYAMARGVVALSTHPDGSGTVTMSPVASTVGSTAGSFAVTVATKSGARTEPAGASVPV